MNWDGHLGPFTACATWEVCFKRENQAMLNPQKSQTQHTVDTQGVSELLMAGEGRKDPRSDKNG